MKYYTRNVRPEIKKYVEKVIFPQYEKNDQGHGILHIREVIRRSFALKDTLKLDLDDDMIFVIAGCHDWGKYEEKKDGEKHAIIAERRFFNDKQMETLFSEEQRTTIKEAIEDHSSSLEDMPRSDYGKLVSSADRNTRIEMVFIRSFFVGKARTPDMRALLQNEVEFKNRYCEVNHIKSRNNKVRDELGETSYKYNDGEDR